MLQILNVNPVAEAMFYYWGKANGERTEKKYNETLRRLPTHKDEIKKAADTAAALEKLLDSKLKTDEALIQKYFKKIESENGKTIIGIIGFCLAAVILNNALVRHLELPADELYGYLRKWKKKERLESFLMNISPKYEALSPEESNEAEFSKRLNDLPIAGEIKYLILDSVFNYKTYLSELFSMLMPAVKIIKAAENVYKSAVEEFKSFYSDDNAQTHFETCFSTIPKMPPVEITRITPTLFGFDTSYGHFAAGTEKDADGVDTQYIHPVINSCIGLIRHLLGSQSPQDEVTVLSENMKTLSDRKRLEMLFYLCSHRAYGQELCSEFNLKQPTMSYHIQKLLDAGFVTAELSGSKTYYAADKAGIQRMIDAFVENIRRQ